MCFTVLLPMLIGPLITMCLNLDKIDDAAPTFAPPFEIFLAATIVAILAIVPIVFVMKDSNRLREKKLQEALEMQATEAVEETTEENKEDTINENTIEENISEPQVEAEETIE